MPADARPEISGRASAPSKQPYRAPHGPPHRGFERDPHRSGRMTKRSAFGRTSADYSTELRIFDHAKSPFPGETAGRNASPTKPGMKSYKARGVVLHTIKYGDSSMVVYLLTDTGGRQSYMVQGVRSSRGRGSKLALFQPMFALEFEGLESPRMQLHRMRDVRNGIVLQSLPFDVRKSTIALFMAETLYRLVRESEPDGPLFDFVWGSVAALDALTEGIANFHLWFLSNLSRFLGFSPGNDYLPDAWFDIREGIYTPSRPAHDEALSRDDACILHDMLECDVRCIAEIGLNRRQRVAYLDALLTYYGYHLDAIHAVRSVGILQEVF